MVEAEAGAGAGFVPSSVVGCEETYCLDTAEYPARDARFYRAQYRRLKTKIPPSKSLISRQQKGG